MQKIRTIKATTIPVGDEDASFVSEIKEFDINGRLLTEIKNTDKDNIAMQTSYKYDEIGNPLEIINVDKEEGTTETTKYEYDEKARLIREETDYFQGFKTILVYTYNDKKITINSIDEDDEIEESTIQEYDDTGNLLSETKLDDNGKLVSKIVNQYDHRGKIIRKDEFEKKEKLSKSHIYYYDNDEQLNGIKTTNRKGKVLDWVRIEYDENNRPIRQTTMSGYSIELSYDAEKLLRNEKHLAPNGNIIQDLSTISDKEGNILEERSPDTIIKYNYYFYTV
jgi:YD repeat-containing protein